MLDTIVTVQNECITLTFEGGEFAGSFDLSYPNALKLLKELDQILQPPRPRRFSLPINLSCL